MYDFNRKELVLTPKKSPSQAPKPLSSLDHTPKKQVWESLSMRKPTPLRNDSSLLSALNEDDSNFKSSISSPSLQRKKSSCSLVLDNDNSDSVLPDILLTEMVTPSKSQQSSSYSQRKSHGKSKSDQSYVTALFLSSDSDDDSDSKKEQARPKSNKNITDSEDSVATEPAINLDFSFTDSNETSVFQNVLAEEIAEKTRSYSPPDTHGNHSQTVCGSEQNSFSDDELAILDISKVSQSEKPPENTTDLKANLEYSNCLSLRSNQSLTTPLTPFKMKFNKLNLSSPSKPNKKKDSSLKTKSACSILVNQTQLTSFFTQKTPDNQLSSIPNVESETIDPDN